MSLKTASEFKDLAEFIVEAAKGRTLVEVVNTGIWGDALIHAGQREFFSHFGISYVQIPVWPKPWRGALWKMYKGRSLRPVGFVSGGGFMQPWYDRPNEVRRASRSFGHFILLPSTLGMTPVLESRKSDIWVRDKSQSTQYVDQYRFCHDMAFFLDPKPRRASEELGLFFRKDKERVVGTLPPGNVDLSAKGTHSSDPEEFLDEIGRFEKIYTDRLHIGIAGALLGRETHLFPSRGGKTRAIFDASLRENYPNVEFHEGGLQELRLGI